MVNPQTGHSTKGSEGNLQLYVNGSWYFWCAKGLNKARTQVACRELRFSKPIDYRSVSNLTDVTGKIIALTDFKCNGSEENVLDCGHSKHKFPNGNECPLLSWIKCGKYRQSTNIYI